MFLFSFPDHVYNNLLRYIYLFISSQLLTLLFNTTLCNVSYSHYMFTIFIKNTHYRYRSLYRFFVVKCEYQTPPRKIILISNQNKIAQHLSPLQIHKHNITLFLFHYYYFYRQRVSFYYYCCFCSQNPCVNIMC